MAKHPFPFSWKALLLAPLVVPIPTAILVSVGNKNALAGIAAFSAIGYTFTLAMIVCLLLPALWAVSRVTKVTAWLSALIGGLLAVPIFIMWDYTSWGASGVDSGPPSTTYAEWASKSWFTIEPLTIISFGLITAAVYQLFATLKMKRS